MSEISETEIYCGIRIQLVVRQANALRILANFSLVGLIPMDVLFEDLQFLVESVSFPGRPLTSLTDFNGCSLATEELVREHP